MTALFDFVPVSAENQPSVDQKRRRQPRFWIGPVVAGSCFALGFGVTQRLMALQAGEAPSVKQFFGSQRFPGSSLDSYSIGREATTRPLMADVAAREAELAKTRPPKPNKAAQKAKQEAARLAREARERRERLAAFSAPVVPAAAVTVVEEPVLIPAPELPPQGAVDAAEAIETLALPDAVTLPDPAPPLPLAAEPLSDLDLTSPPPGSISPLIEVTPEPDPAPLTVPASAELPMP